ncbi:hypothetical protein [Kitasatospora purpeofusca]|uniref:hypothetical protein n=1 Tax=Kitasatospora purpeofusca TaxID=67352 RepID=UPI0036CD0848
MVRPPLDGINVNDVFALTTGASMARGGNPGWILTVRDPRQPATGAADLDVAVALAIGDRGHLDWVRDRLTHWLVEHACYEMPPYLDVRSGLDLDLSPPGLVQPAFFNFTIMGGDAVAGHSFRGPWPLLRLIFTVRSPFRNRVLVTLGAAEAAELVQLFDC